MEAYLQPLATALESALARVIERRADSPLNALARLLLDEPEDPVGERESGGTSAAYAAVHSDLAAARPDLASKLGARLAALNAGNYDPDRGKGDKAACKRAEENGGFYGPWVGV